MPMYADMCRTCSHTTQHTHLQDVQGSTHVSHGQGHQSIHAISRHSHTEILQQIWYVNKSGGKGRV